MAPATRLLDSSSGSPPVYTPDSTTLDSDVVVILAALLCALICVIGLALVARCACLRRSLSVGGGGHSRGPPPNKGLKKKALQSLPKTSFDDSVAAGGRLAECAICLAEFVQGDEIRVLPQCGHGFHVSCVDTWLGSHSSCPFCRQVLVVAVPSRCCRCGASPNSVGSIPETEEPSAAAELGAKAREDSYANRFLP